MTARLVALLATSRYLWRRVFPPPRPLPWQIDGALDGQVAANLRQRWDKPPTRPSDRLRRLRR